MTSALLLPGFSPDRTFSDPSLDVLKREMAIQDVFLRGVEEGWKDHGVWSFGRRAVEQARVGAFDGILIGHSLGSLAALSAIDTIPTQHLILCSPSALFSEDIDTSKNNEISQRLGGERVRELSGFSAANAVVSVNRLGIPTTVLFGEKERELFPHLVARSEQLASEIAGAELIEIAGAAHFIGENPYARELARIVGNIASRLQ